ncbi:MAG: hypothetical protein ACYC6S_04230 [Desulfobulbia bacterium]
MKKIIFMLFLLFLCRQAVAAPIVLEESTVSEKDQNKARSIRDSTRAPNSLIGGVAESAGKAIAESSQHQNSSCQAGNCDWVTVNFDVIAGFSTEGLDRKFSMTPVDSATGRVEQNASKNGVAIFKSIRPSVSGYYLWSASWDKDKKACSGKVYITGAKPSVTINIYSDCSSPSKHEF